jgi:hypothetical protein
MVFFQLTIDANDPALLARFWGQALGFQSVPPTHPDTTWWAHYRDRVDDDGGFYDRLFDPEGLRPPIWFQEVPEGKPDEPKTGSCPGDMDSRSFLHRVRKVW